MKGNPLTIKINTRLKLAMNVSDLICGGSLLGTERIGVHAEVNKHNIYLWITLTIRMNERAEMKGAKAAEDNC